MTKPRPQLLAERKREITNMELVGSAVLPGFRPTPEMLADAWRRNTAPRSIIAWIAGDPAPGFSALDKKSRHGPPRP